MEAAKTYRKDTQRYAMFSDSKSKSPKHPLILRAQGQAEREPSSLVPLFIFQYACFSPFVIVSLCDQSAWTRWNISSHSWSACLRSHLYGGRGWRKYLRVHSFTVYELRSLPCLRFVHIPCQLVSMPCRHANFVSRYTLCYNMLCV